MYGGIICCCIFNAVAVVSVTELVGEQHVQLLQIIVQFLPTANVLLLKHLLGLLRRVCEQKETRMTAASLGRLFAPHLIIPRTVRTTSSYTDTHIIRMYSHSYKYNLYKSG